MLIVQRRLYYGEGIADGAIEVDVIFVDVVFAADVVIFVGVGGIPHIVDSVSFMNLSLGLHIAAFCCGVNDGGGDNVILLP